MPDTESRRGVFSRFSLREWGLLLAMLGAVAICGATLHTSDRVLREQEKRVEYAREELRRAKDDVRDAQRGKSPDRHRSFWEADLDGTNLTGMTLSSDGNAFQRASFRECQLDHATLRGGAAAFQAAKFDGASLVHAQLIGGDAAFQGATFVGANLTGATLNGGSASFQGASFENAVMIDATLAGHFQSVNLSGVQLQGANLSSIAPENLASCHFDVPPTFNGKSKLPVGFDPVQHVWRRVD